MLSISFHTSLTPAIVRAGLAFALMTGAGGPLLGGVLGDCYEKSFICVLWATALVC